MTSANDRTERFELVRRKADEWAKKLVDLSQRNTALYFKNTKTTSLDLSAAAPDALDALLSGQATRLSTLIPDPQAQSDACKRARLLNRRITAFEEEQGLDVGKLAHGLVTVPASQVSASVQKKPVRAPLLLRTVRITARTITENDYRSEARRVGKGGRSLG